MRTDSLFKRLAVACVLGFILIFAVIPNLLLLAASFATRDPSRFIEPVLTLGNYAALIDPSVLAMFRQSLFLAAMAAALCLFMGYPFAYVLARSGRRQGNLLLMLVMIPFWTNSLVRAHAMVIMLKGDGILNSLLMKLGLISAPLTIMYTQWAVFIGLVYMLLPFMILPLYTAIQRLDTSVLEAARDLGAGRWNRFKEIILPLTMPGVVSGCIMVFLPALGMFYIPDMFGGARSMLLGNYVRDQFLTTRNWPLGAAASISMTLLMGVLLLVYFRSLAHAGKRRAL